MPDNPTGRLTINNLELAGALLGLLVLAGQDMDLRFSHLVTFCNNMTTVVWAYRPRNWKSVVAGFLLCFLGLFVHQLGCSSLVAHHIAADAISRAFKRGQFYEAANNLVPYFNTNFPLHRKHGGENVKFQESFFHP